MIFDPRLVGEHSPILVNQEEVEQVTTYMYLGIYFDSQLRCSHQVDYVCTRASQRLHFLRRLRVYGVDKSIMLLFYRLTIESIICYGFTNWFGNFTVKLRSQLQNVLRRAGKIIGMLSPLSLQDIFERSVRKQSLKIIGDPSHILHKEYELMPTGRR